MDDETKIEEENKQIYDTQIAFSGDAYNNDPIKREVEAMKDSRYITDRLDYQLDWYDQKASSFQKKYKTIRRWEIIIAASIPVLIGFAAMNFLESTVLIESTLEGIKNGKPIQGPPVLTLSTIFQIIAAIGGVAIIVLKGINELEDYYKNWKEYRLTSELLRQEKFKYLTRTEPYDESNAFPMLVEKVEFILNKETQRWNLVSKKSNEASDKALSSVDKLLKKKTEKDTVVK